MDDAGIDKSVIFTLDGLFIADPNTNDEVAAFAAFAPSRFVPFASVDPRSRTAVDEVQRCLFDLGMRGLKFHPWVQGFSPHEPFMDDICAVAHDAGVPILFHDGTPPYSTALQIAVLARRHPEVRFVLGHSGLHDLWREAIRATSSVENVYACISGPPPFAIRAIIDRCPPTRVVFGTDAGLGSGADQRYVRSRLREIRMLLTPEEQDRVLFTNPRDLLSL